MYQPESKSYFSWFLITCLAIVLLYLGYVLWDVLTPFIIGIILAYFLNPIVNYLTKRMSRILASLMVVVGTYIVILLFFAFLIPVLIEQIRELIDKMPIVLNWIQTNSGKINLPYVIQEKFNFKDILSFDNLNQFWLQNSETIQSLLFKASNYLRQTGSSILLIVYNILMLPITLLYFLYVWPKMIGNFKKLIPLRYHNSVFGFTRELDLALSGFIRGQFIVMLAMGFLYGIGLYFTGLTNGFAIGFMTGFLVFIPYFGFIVGSILATFAAILQYGDIWHLLGVWVVFGVGQGFESFLITPKLIGDRIGLSPVLVIFALLAFGQLFGFVGMLLALPLSAIFVVIVKAVIGKYHKSDFFLEE